MTVGRTFSQLRFASRLHKPKFLPKVVKAKAEVKGEILYGIHPVRMALERGERTFHRLFYNPGSRRCREEVVEDCLRKSIECVDLSPSALDELSRRSTREAGVHQGVCADVSPLEGAFVEDLADLDAAPSGLWVLACSIGDPRNLGAILRSAYFLGVRRVLTCDVSFDAAAVPKATSSLSPVASKASSGVMEVFEPVHVSNPFAFLEDISADEGWEVIGTGSTMTRNDEDSASSRPRKLLVVGNEGYGVPEYLERFCARSVAVRPGRELHPFVDSLNVSVATALLIQAVMNEPPGS